MFGIGGGPSGQELSEAGMLANIGNFGASQGEADTLKAQSFWSSILSGDQSKISQVLGPEISSMNKNAQQQKKTMSEFGTRSGGTASAMSSLDTSTISGVRDMIAKLTGGAAGSLGSMGGSLLGTGANATQGAFDAYAYIQKQRQDKWNDIFNTIGSSIKGAMQGAQTGGGAGAIAGGIGGMFDEAQSGDGGGGGGGSMFG